MAFRVFRFARALALAAGVGCGAGFSPDDSIRSMWGYSHCPDEIAASATSKSTASAPPTDLTWRDWTFDVAPFFAFCKDTPNAVLCKGAPGTRLPIAVIGKLDDAFRAHFRYRSDEAVWHTSDRWAAWSLCGDCEDYALGLAELLARAGEGGAFMRLGLMFAPVNTAQTLFDGHATLLVETSDAGAVEVGVGSGEQPESIDWTWGHRVATIRMDGKQQIHPFLGYRLDLKDGLVVPIPKAKA